MRGVTLVFGSQVSILAPFEIKNVNNGGMVADDSRRKCKPRLKMTCHRIGAEIDEYPYVGRVS